MIDDTRQQDTRNPNIDFKSFIYKNYKDLIALIIILVFGFLLIFVSAESDVKAVLISLISTATGFIFGKRRG